VPDPSRDYRKGLLRLAAFLVRDDAEAAQVVGGVLASSPSGERDAQADRRAVVIRCHAIVRERKGLPPA